MLVVTPNWNVALGRIKLLYVAMFLLPLTVSETVAAVIAISSKSFHVEPESLEMKIRTNAAALVAAHWESISRTLVPVAAPVINDVIEPLPSLAVFAAETLTPVSLGVAMNAGLVATLSLLYISIALDAKECGKC